jgi:kynurenine formamidase
MLKSKYPPITLKEFDTLFEKLKNWNKWGADDEIGTLNYITPDKIKAAAALVRSGRSVSMAIPIDKVAGPDNPHPAIHYMACLHDTDIGTENLGFASDFLGMQFHGDCFTHMDSLCHLSYKGLLYNGVPDSKVDVTGAHTMDVTAYANGIVGRGVLFDMPRHFGVKWLESGHAVTADEIIAAEKSQGVKLEEGDIMLFRTGQYTRRLEEGPWDVGPTGKGRAGLHPFALELLHDRKVSAFLPEGDGEVIPGFVEDMEYPIHPLQIASMGMFVADSLQLNEVAEACEEEGRFECMVVVAPLRLPNGTGCPFNPIAIF